VTRSKLPFYKEHPAALHAALGSGAVFVINGLLVLYVIDFERKIKQ